MRKLISTMILILICTTGAIAGTLTAQQLANQNQIDWINTEVWYIKGLARLLQTSEAMVDVKVKTLQQQNIMVSTYNWSNVDAVGTVDANKVGLGNQ